MTLPGDSLLENHRLPALRGICVWPPECNFSFSLEWNSYCMIEQHFAITAELNAGLHGEGMRVWKLAVSESVRTLLPGQRYEEAAQVDKGNFYRKSETLAELGNSRRNHKYHSRTEAKENGGDEVAGALWIWRCLSITSSRPMARDWEGRCGLRWVFL